MRAAQPTAAEINMDRLPPGLRELVDALGFTGALRLVQARGGQSVLVPKTLNLERPTPAVQRLLDELGSVRAVAALIDWRGGETINHLPKYDAIARQLRHAHVRQLRREGYSANEIAQATNYSRRWVMDVLSQARDEALYRQGDLFEDFDPAPEAAAPVAPTAPTVPLDPFGRIPAHAARTAMAAPRSKPV